MTIEQTTTDDRRVTIFKALADPTRLSIIRMLYSKKAEINCGEISEQLKLTKSNASYHFKTLREAGLTTTRKEGQSKHVSLNTDVFERMMPGFLAQL